MIGYKDRTVQIITTSPAPKMLSRTSRDIGLSDDEVRDYFEVGWITRQALFSDEEVARIRACFDELEKIATGLAETGLHCG